MSSLAVIADDREWIHDSVSPRTKSDIAKADIPQATHAAEINTSTLGEAIELADDDSDSGTSQLSHGRYLRIFLGLLIGTVIECEIYVGANTFACL